MILRGSRNLEFLLENFDFEKSQKQIKQGFVHEGGSGAGKTQDIIRFLLYYCQVNLNKGKDILIFRQTLADLKKTVYKDFMKVLREHGIYNPNHDAQSPPLHYELYGNVIYFSGLDTMGAHGERHDIIWGNEGMEIDRDAFKQLNQRCNEAFILDFNPSEIEHWIFDEILTRPDTKHIITTQADNPFLPQGQRQEILAYRPTAQNILNGTADEYLWNVYGLGLRSAPEGLVFQHVNWVADLPDAETFYYGMDFGSVHPTVLVKACVVDRDLFAKILFYEPVDNPDRIIELLEAAGMTDREVIWADSAAAGTISYLRRKGWTVLAVSKPKDSVITGIGLLKNYKINLVDCPEWRKEQTGYRWQVVNGQRTGQPIKKFDHGFDSLRYLVMANFQ